ncbi:hypothetical protein N8I74_00840 [Chitiniphilus purpureus]|uniref:Uncharacterized protein n=1 Tax=Chitiniphilus purpureus TaxID=2981137 RepID=A0ABY6DPH7_9NEIS|nr:hypothetical protein [Chitiniphilus sp. CD1]UXY15593.1 hypothetical protein N8I74_00840 [Chitiniphilus sp. CD1]
MKLLRVLFYLFLGWIALRWLLQCFHPQLGQRLDHTMRIAAVVLVLVASVTLLGQWLA